MAEEIKTQGDGCSEKLNTIPPENSGDLQDNALEVNAEIRISEKRIEGAESAENVLCEGIYINEKRIEGDISADGEDLSGQYKIEEVPVNKKAVPLTETVLFSERAAAVGGETNTEEIAAPLTENAAEDCAAAVECVEVQESVEMQKVPENAEESPVCSTENEESHSETEDISAEEAAGISDENVGEEQGKNGLKEVLILPEIKAEEQTEAAEEVAVSEDDSGEGPKEPTVLLNESGEIKEVSILKEKESKPSGNVDKIPVKEVPIGVRIRRFFSGYDAGIHGIEEVRLPINAKVVNRRGEKIGKIRGGTWYDNDKNCVGDFIREDRNVYYRKEEELRGYVDKNNNIFTFAEEYLGTIKYRRGILVIIIAVIMALLVAVSSMLAAYYTWKSENTPYAPTLFIADTNGDWDQQQNLDVFFNDTFGDNKIMPGQSGKYAFTFENRNDDALTYDLTFTCVNDYGIGLVYRLKRDGAYIAGREIRVDAEGMSQHNLTIEANSSSVFEIEWYWEDNDSVDTNAGENSAKYTLNIHLLAWVSQFESAE